VSAANTATKPHAAYCRDCQHNPETTAKGLSCNVISNKMKKTYPISTLVLLLFMIASCHKDNPDNQTRYFYLSESLNPYKFKTGSFWIFQNDTTAILDSILVTSTEHDFYWLPPPIHGQSGDKHEYYKINLKSFATLHIYNDYLTNYYIKRDGGGDYGENGQPIFMTNSDTGSVFNGMKIIAKFPIMTINGNTFTNVIETKITASQQYQPIFVNDTYLFYTESIGLIKQVADIGNGNFESWSIKRWTVIK
jgi:hypothetical protein